MNDGAEPPHRNGRVKVAQRYVGDELLDVEGGGNAGGGGERNARRDVIRGKLAHAAFPKIACIMSMRFCNSRSSIMCFL
ncbi:hypothetical protein D3C73_1592680 [compost metagenome]